MIGLIQKTSKQSLLVCSLGIAAMSFSLNAFAQSVQIGALMSGQVSEVFVKEGQSVKSGQKLLTLDVERFQAKQAFLEAQVALQQAKLADAQIELDTALDLFDRTVTSRRTLDAAKLAFTIAQSEADKAKAELQIHKAKAKYVYINAPIAAKVVKVMVAKGTTVFEENQLMIELQPQ